MNLLVVHLDRYWCRSVAFLQADPPWRSCAPSGDLQTRLGNRLSQLERDVTCSGRGMPTTP